MTRLDGVTEHCVLGLLQERRWPVEEARFIEIFVTANNEGPSASFPGAAFAEVLDLLQRCPVR